MLIKCYSSQVNHIFHFGGRTCVFIDHIHNQGHGEMSTYMLTSLIAYAFSTLVRVQKPCLGNGAAQSMLVLPTSINSIKQFFTDGPTQCRLTLTEILFAGRFGLCHVDQKKQTGSRRTYH